ncbi:MAG: hypothetical protein JXQ99_29100 [Hyphomicrobiaceae bacterium]
MHKLGVVTRSQYFREWTGSSQNEIERWPNDDGDYCPDNVACYTTTELGEMLPWQLHVGAHRYELDLFKNGEEPSCWSVGYTTKDEEVYKVLGMNYHFGNTEADARAKMLIYLLENDLLNVADL